MAHGPKFWSAFSSTEKAEEFISVRRLGSPNERTVVTQIMANLAPDVASGESFEAGPNARDADRNI